MKNFTLIEWNFKTINIMSVELNAKKLFESLVSDKLSDIQKEKLQYACKNQ